MTTLSYNDPTTTTIGLKERLSLYYISLSSSSFQYYSWSSTSHLSTPSSYSSFTHKKIQKCFSDNRLLLLLLQSNTTLINYYTLSRSHWIQLCSFRKLNDQHLPWLDDNVTVIWLWFEEWIIKILCVFYFNY